MRILQFNTKHVFGSKDKSLLLELGNKVIIFDRYHSNLLNSTNFIVNYLKSFVKNEKIDLFYWWFVLERTKVILSKMLKIPSLVMNAGFEVCSEPSIKYGYDFLPKKKQNEIKYILKNADLIMFPSKIALSSAKDISDNDNYVLNYNAVDIDLYKPLNHEKKDQIITVGVISKASVIVKGFQYFVKTIPLVKKEHPEVKFIIMGTLLDKEALDFLLQLRKKLNIQENLDFILIPSQEQRSKIRWIADSSELIITKLNESKIYLQLSAHESFGMAMAEAMSCGLPVIGTNRGAIPEVLGKTENIVNFGDINEIAEKVLDLLSDPKKMRTDGLSLRKRIISKFSKEQRKKRFKKILNIFQ